MDFSIPKALLNADLGNWITLEDGRSAKIVKIAKAEEIAGEAVKPHDKTTDDTLGERL